MSIMNSLLLTCVVLMGGLFFTINALSVEEARAKLIKLNVSKNQKAAGDYYFGPEFVTFSQAQTNCQEAGLSLLAVDTRIEQNVINAYLLDTTDFNGWKGDAWIAGTDRGSPGTFYWQIRSTSSPKQMQFTNWGNGGLNGCVTMSNFPQSAGFWFINLCSNRYRYYCEA